MGFVKATIRRALPRKFVAAYRNRREQALSRRDQRLSTEQVFTDIYSTNRWGGESGSFCSGSGSHDAAIVSPYITHLTAHLERLGAAAMTVVDLGCGDYAVGSRLSPHCGHYVGVDIVKPLVAYNQATFGTEKVSFRHVNIVDEALPDGDICFVRQVLQHLSNEQITAVLPKLNQFRWCFVTEHHPSPGRLGTPNEDKPHGDRIRIGQRSGVFLEQPPFNIPDSRYRLLLEVPGTVAIDETDPGVIRTYLLTAG
jgi:ribosomal protein L32